MELRGRLTAATARINDVSMDRQLKITISEVCSLLDVDGIRGDITTNKAARALAAFEGDTEVTIDHVRRVISLCLNHRWAGPLGHAEVQVHACAELSYGRPQFAWRLLKKIAD